MAICASLDGHGQNDLGDAVVAQLKANAASEFFGGEARTEKALPAKPAGAPAVKEP